MFLGLFVMAAGMAAISAPAAAQRWEVVNAEWGAGRRVIDVTDVVRSLSHAEGR